MKGHLYSVLLFPDAFLLYDGEKRGDYSLFSCQVKQSFALILIYSMKVYKFEPIPLVVCFHGCFVTI